MMISRLTILCLVGFLWTAKAQAMMGSYKFSELLAVSDTVVVVKLAKVAGLGKPAQVLVLQTIKGEVKPQATIQILYPLPHVEDIEPLIRPREGLVLLALLRKAQDGSYAAATTFLKRRRQLENGQEIIEEYYSPGYGTQCFKLTSEADAGKVGALVSQYVNWQKLAPPERVDLLRQSLAGPLSMRLIALDWLLWDHKLSFDKRSDMSDELVAGLLENVSHQDVSIRNRAMAAIGRAATFRKDLIAYLVDALDDPVMRDYAVYRLDGKRGWGPGPVLDPKATLAEKVAVPKRLRQSWIAQACGSPRRATILGLPCL